MFDGISIHIKYQRHHSCNKLNLSHDSDQCNYQLDQLFNNVHSEAAWMFSLKPSVMADRYLCEALTSIQSKEFLCNVKDKRQKVIA